MVYMQGSLLLLVELHKSRKKKSCGCTEIQSKPNMCVFIYILLEVKQKSKAEMKMPAF